MFTDLLTAAGSHQSALVLAADGRQVAYAHQMDGNEQPRQTAFTDPGGNDRDQTAYLEHADCRPTEYSDISDVTSHEINVEQTSDENRPVCSESAEGEQQLVFAESADHREHNPMFTATAQVMDGPIYRESAENNERSIFPPTDDNGGQEIYPESPDTGDQPVYQELSEVIRDSVYQETVENDETEAPVYPAESIESCRTPMTFLASADDREPPVFPESGRDVDELRFSAEESDGDPLDGCPYDGDVDLAGD